MAASGTIKGQRITCKINYAQFKILRISGSRRVNKKKIIYRNVYRKNTIHKSDRILTYIAFHKVVQA